MKKMTVDGPSPLPSPIGRGSVWEILHWEPTTFAKGYLLLLGALFFLWPVVVGIPIGALRFLWIACAAVLSLMSAVALDRSLRASKPHALTMPPLVCIGLFLLCVLLMLYGATIPLLAFSDEASIAVPSLTILGKIARATTWTGLFIIVEVGFSLLPIALGMMRRAWIILVFALMVAIACAAAFLLPESQMMVRYPPLVHFVQAFAGATTFGALAYLRTPNVFWTFALGLTLWEWKAWPAAARIAAFTGILLGPLGWTYRTVLYQACGELTLGMLASLFLAKIIIDQREQDARGALLGVVSALWFLYRPTALAGVIAIFLLLGLLRRWRALRSTFLVSAPAIVAWLILAPIFTASYGSFTEGFPLQSAAAQALPALVATFRALPLNLDPAALGILLLTTLFALALGSRETRTLLGCSWLLALATAVLQQLTAGPVFVGVARYNILLLLPLGVGIGGLVHLMERITLPGKTGLVPRLAPLLGLLSLAVLIWITPYDFVEFAQVLRARSADIYRTPTEGYLPVPLLTAVRVHANDPHLVVLAPQTTFIDLLVAIGELTAAQRSAITERSQHWTTASTDRPVIIQAPVLTHYGPNLSPKREEFLKEARAWALQQPHHSVVRLGTEETIFVP